MPISTRPRGSPKSGATFQKMIDWLNTQGAQVIEVDTDGIYFVPPTSVSVGPAGLKPRWRGEDARGEVSEELRRGLAKVLPPGIEDEFDEQFEAMFSYKAKNYALLTREGEVIIKGGALKSRGLEKFQRVFLEEMIKLLMEGKPEGIAIENDFERKIRERGWKIEMLMKTDTVQDSLREISAKDCRLGVRNRAAAYELALTSGRNYRPGDQISYYITGAGKKNSPPTRTRSSRQISIRKTATKTSTTISPSSTS